MERDPTALTFYFSQIDPRGEGPADENRRFARSMASKAMRDILYGEHDSIKHSIKSSLINLTLAHGGGRRWDPRGAPPPLSCSASPIVGAISGRCLRERERDTRALRNTGHPQVARWARGTSFRNCDDVSTREFTILFMGAEKHRGKADDSRDITGMRTGFCNRE